MRYPTINEFLDVVKSKSDPQVSFNVMVSCMDKLASEDEVFKFDEYTQEEKEAFIDDLDANVVKQINTFFDTTPKLRHEMKYINSNKEEKTFVIEGMETFFI